VICLDCTSSISTTGFVSVCFNTLLIWSFIWSQL
jgi:hypothetical protein